MKSTGCLRAVLLLSLSAAVNIVRADLVVPSTVPLSGTLSTIFRADGGRQFQQYISAGQFGSLSAPAVITGLQVLPSAAWPPSALNFANYTIIIGRASDALAAAHGTFDPGIPYLANLQDPVTVFNGSLTLPANTFIPGVANPVIAFNTSNYSIQPGQDVVVYINHSISDRPDLATPGFATVDTTSDPAAASAVYNRDDTSTGWSGGNGEAAAPYRFNFVTAPRLVNLSTRATVGSGAAILIGGFIVEGTAPKKVVVRALGPSLAVFNLPNLLSNPQLTVFNAVPAQIAANDDWQTNSASDAQALQDANLTPGDPRESALVLTLEPGAYTAQVSGVGGATGNALLEIYDIDPLSVSTAVNLSARAMVQTGNDVAIGGLIVEGDNSRLLIRGIGPSLAAMGVSGALANPTLELHDESGAVVASNDEWAANANAAEISATGLAPTDAHESAVLRTLPPGRYTCILRGAGNTSGVGRIDVIPIP